MVYSEYLLVANEEKAAEESMFFLANTYQKSQCNSVQNQLKRLW